MKDDDKPPMLRESAAPYKAGAGRTRRRKARAPAWDFWHPPTIEQLAAEQGTKPMTRESLESADFWPTVEDFDEFLKAALGQRHRGRR